LFVVLDRRRDVARKEIIDRAGTAGLRFEPRGSWLAGVSRLNMRLDAGLFASPALSETGRQKYPNSGPSAHNHRGRSRMEVINDWQFIEAVMAARTLEDVEQVGRRAMRAMGFNHCAYVLKRPVPAPLPGTPAQDPLFFFHDLPRDWARSRYESLRSSAGEQGDARVQHVRAGMPATAWSSLGQVSHTRTDIGQRARGLLRSAGEHGLKAGLTVPLWTPGIQWAFMTLTTDATADLRELRSTLAPMNYFASCLHSTVRRLQGDAKVPVLSARQREVLHWVAVGKSTWEISEILNISERTVYFHLVGAAAKLDTQGRTATCARALALGLLNP